MIVISTRGLRQTVRRAPAARFVRSAYLELRKAQWPTPEQTARLTALVLAISVLMAIILGLADLGFDRLFGLITS
jgi:preprotein translocase SecE subunit